MAVRIKPCSAGELDPEMRADLVRRGSCRAQIFSQPDVLSVASFRGNGQGSAGASPHQVAQISIRLGCLALSVFIGSNLGWCYAQPVASSSLKIGILLPPEEAQSASIREGVLVAQERAGRTGNIEIIIRGRAGQWGADADEAARMVTDDGVVGLVAPPDGAASHLVLQVSGRTAVPVASLCGDSLVTLTGVPWMLRVAPRTVEEARALFQAIPGLAALKRVRWAAVVPEGRAGREVSHDLTQAASDCHAELGGIVETDNSCTNFDVLKAKVLQCRPEGILVWLAPIPAGKLANNLRQGGFTGAMAGPCSLKSASFVASAKDALEDFIIPSIFRDETSTKLFSSFQTAYRARWGHDADAVAGMSYDAVVVLTHLIQSTFQAATHRFPPDFSEPGVTGQLSFDEQGNRKLTLELLKGHDGKFVRIHGN
jgi:ABC-type branched-subunit amino acid transport system substrate-binding protein